VVFDNSRNDKTHSNDTGRTQNVMRGFVGALVGAAAAGALAMPQPGDDKKTDSTPPAKKSPPPEFKSSKDKASYSIGLHLGLTILKDFGRGDAIDPEQFVKGLKTGLAGEMPLEARDLQSSILDYRIEVIKADAARYLEENKKKEGVKTTASGLQYQVIKENAEGKKATENAKVKVHYTGTLVNGTKFDSSLDRGEPAEFTLKKGPGGVIAGWVEGLQLMKVGDKYRFFIPPELGYGAKGSRIDESGKQSVPPHAVLVFEVELLEVK
jgi:FKBP-type peptidyl-prolyl cis-trans isomerase